MVQAKFSLEEAQITFLEQCQEYGFKDKSSVIRTAIDRLHHELERKKLEQSAGLYAELYEMDDEIKELTELGVRDWPA